MVTITVKHICDYAIFEQDGINLRKEILKHYGGNEPVELDFAEIELFATMFFNASIGWLVLRDGADAVKRRLSFRNLSELGLSTCRHSFENATQVRKNPLYKEALADYADEAEPEGD